MGDKVTKRAPLPVQPGYTQPHLDVFEARLHQLVRRSERARLPPKLGGSRGLQRAADVADQDEAVLPGAGRHHLQNRSQRKGGCDCVQCRCRCCTPRHTLRQGGVRAERACCKPLLQTSLMPAHRLKEGGVHICAARMPPAPGHNCKPPSWLVTMQQKKRVQAIKFQVRLPAHLLKEGGVGLGARHSKQSKADAAGDARGVPACGSRAWRVCWFHGRQAEFAKRCRLALYPFSAPAPVQQRRLCTPFAARHAPVIGR